MKILLFVAFTLICFALSPRMQAVNPPPDGGYAGFNTAEGTDALFSNTTGTRNTGLGYQALYYNHGDYNTATGSHALFSNTNGTENTATGASALSHNTSGSDNTATGFLALRDNTSGSQNTASGAWALLSNTGHGNTATGAYALFHNTSGFDNVANGAFALYRSQAGSLNTATGAGALSNNTTGHNNTATGRSALSFNTSGFDNTGIGVGALGENRTGYNNTALGAGAGIRVITANNVICIGSEVEGRNVSNTTWIGSVYGGFTHNAMTAPVIVSADGQLGTVASSKRFKKDIASMEKDSEVILSLRPVTFHYKSDATGTPQFGLIAEDVAKVNPALVLPDKEGKPYTVRYDAVNAMLLNEFLKEHRKVEEQRRDFEAAIAQQQKQIDALTAGLQEVSAELELSKAAPQTAENNQ